ncbi:MAG TPA: hypothetical protein VKU00_08425 [Chthonomonadaceae bacterium]|nr:hypothetical protein [Chthonomonadaceae bacterium]
MKQQEVVVVKAHHSARLTNPICHPRPCFTRREFGILAALGAVSLLSPGCGGGGGNNNSTPNPNPTPNRGIIYVGTALSSGYDMGINTSGGQTNWVTDQHGYMDCAYPAGQQWGAIFITAGKVGNNPPTTYDYSSYNFLVLDLKGAVGGEQASVGVKTESDPNNGQEPLFVASNLTTSWQTFKIPLSSLIAGSTYPSSRFSHLYVVCELVFTGSPETISFRNVQYEM